MTDQVKIGVVADSKKLVEAVKTGDKALDQLGDQAKVTGRELDGMGQEAAGAERKIEEVAKASEKAERATRRLGAGATSIRTYGKAAIWASEKVVNRYTAMGAGFTVAAAGLASAKLDKKLIGIKQTAGATREQASQLRADLLRLGAETGQPIDELADGFGNLVASGQGWEASRQQIAATAKAMAVTSAGAGTLTNALTVAAESFGFDLSKPGLALEILDKMVVAGRLGSAELESLSDIFARIGVGAKASGMTFEQTLAFVETLSATEKNAERLATLADSTLRLFTNLNYMRDATKATGVKFFDAKGARRDAVAVLAEFQAKYRKLKTEQERSNWFGKAFGKTDMQTITGMRVLLEGEALSKGVDFSSQIAGASGAIVKDLPEATDNLIDQFGRLTSVAREASEAGRPLVSGLTRAVGFLADNKTLTQSGLAAGAGLVAVSGAVVAVGTVLKNWQEIRGILGAGKGRGGALETVLGGAGGGQKVFVTNWPGGAGGAWQKYGSPTIGRDSAPPGGSTPASGRGRMARLLARPGAGGALVGATSLMMYGNTMEGWGGMAGAVAGAEFGAKLGSFGGPIGVAIGTMAGATFGSTVAPWMVENAKQHKLDVASKELLDFRSEMEAGRMRFNSASDATRMPPINLNLTNQVDAQGRTTTTVSGPDASRVKFNSQVIAPTWAMGDK